MTAHRIVVTVGQGENTASTGAKKKPVPMYQDEPARSDFSTKRSQRGMDEVAGESSGTVVLLSVSSSQCPPQVMDAITSEVTESNWYDHLTSGH